jgi:hypothetical protein
MSVAVCERRCRGGMQSRTVAIEHIWTSYMTVWAASLSKMLPIFYSGR